MYLEYEIYNKFSCIILY